MFPLQLFYFSSTYIFILCLFSALTKSHLYMCIQYFFFSIFLLYKWFFIPLHYGYECNNVHNATIYLCYATSMLLQFSKFQCCWNENINLWSILVMCLEKFISLFRYTYFVYQSFVCCALTVCMSIKISRESGYKKNIWERTIKSEKYIFNLVLKSKLNLGKF